MAGIKGKAGRKRIGAQLFIRAEKAQHDYLRRVRDLHGLSDLSAAGRLVLIEAEKAGVAMSANAPVAEPRECAA